MNIKLETTIRFANIFKLSNVSVDRIENVLKTIKTEASLDLSCYQGLWSNEILLSQIYELEGQLQIQSSRQRMKTLSSEELAIAAEMFLYLASCPTASFKYWSSFYTDLFLTQSADQIILSLNRMMKIMDTEIMDRAKKLLN